MSRPSTSTDRAEAFIKQVDEALRCHRLLTRGARVVLGVSGGQDSMALLHAMARLRQAWGWTLSVAHVNHGLRPRAAADAAFVSHEAGLLGVPVDIVERNVLAQRRGGESLEEVARHARYEAFTEIARRRSAMHVALAHTADDQAETVLMRLLRGAGVTGLSGMPRHRRLGEAQLIRPLLDFWRTDVEACVAACRIRFVEDETNTHTRFLRNRIRHELLPLLAREYNPNIKGVLVQLAAQCHTDAAYLQAAASRWWKRLVRRHGPQVSVRIAPFARLDPSLQRQLVRRAIQQLQGDLDRFEFRHWVEVDALLHQRPEGSVVDLPGGLQVVRNGEELVFRALPVHATVASLVVDQTPRVRRGRVPALTY